jgi:hypothetical protein
MTKLIAIACIAIALTGCEEPDLDSRTKTQARAIGAYTCQIKMEVDTDWHSRKAFLAYRAGYEAAGCKTTLGWKE